MKKLITYISLFFTTLGLAQTAPTGITPNRPQFNEGTVNPSITLVAVDPDAGDAHTFAKDGTGFDDARFSISGNTLTLNLTPDFENPVDSNTNNVYGVYVIVTDSQNNTFRQDITFTILDVDENGGNPPTSTGSAVDPLKAFPSQVDTVNYITGGRGGVVFKVKNLNNSGDGSARDAWQSSQAGYIVYDIAGYIGVSGNSIVPKDDKTIFGQSAFRQGGGGIVYRMGSVKHSGALVGNPNSNNPFGNHIIRYSSFKRGEGNPAGECCGDNFSPWGVARSGANRPRFVIDHSSFMFGIDQTLSFVGCYMVSVQYSIVSWGLYLATHEYTIPGPKPPFISTDTGHSKGSIVGDIPFAYFFGNSYGHDDQRTLKLQAGAQQMNVTYMSNLTYNRGTIGFQIDPVSGSPVKLNMISNKWINGADTSTSRRDVSFPDRSSYPNYGSSKIYLNGNDSPRLSGGDQYTIVGDRLNEGSLPAANQSTNQSLVPINIGIPLNRAISANELEAKLLPHIGASIKRDASDAAYIASVTNRTGRIINGPSRGTDGNKGDFIVNTGGYQPLAAMATLLLDAGDNGIEDAYEVAGATLPNSMIIPSGTTIQGSANGNVTTGRHNQVIQKYSRNDGKVWYNPGYTAIEVRYFTQLDVNALTWVTEETTTISPALAAAIKRINNILYLF